MSTMVYMKLLEQSPAGYDRGMRILTLGRIDLFKRQISERWVNSGDEVLEIGCGTGSLAALMMERGAHVVGIDISEAMLEVARTNAAGAELVHMTATEIETFGKGRFDRIVATLSLSELSADELRHVLRAAAVVLKPGGTFVIADEVQPRTWWQRALAAVVRWPLAALTFLLTRSSTRALRNIEGELDGAGLRVVHDERRLAGSLALVIAQEEVSR